MSDQFRIGSRPSQLALAQAKMLVDALRVAAPGITASIVPIATTGDLKQGDKRACAGWVGTASPGTGVADKREWILEHEQALIEGRIDCAIHSSKDVPIEIDPATVLLPILKRGNPFDAFVAHPRMRGSGEGDVGPLPHIPTGAVIGTSSLRRSAQLRLLRPDLQIQEIRGNVPTRLQKLKDSEELSGIVLARAGFERLGLAGEISATFSPEELMPAVNQGILVVQFLATERGPDSRVHEVLARLVDAETDAVWRAERAFIERIGADCDSAVSVFGSFLSGGPAVNGIHEMKLSARVLAEDGSEMLEGEQIFSIVDYSTEDFNDSDSKNLQKTQGDRDPVQADRVQASHKGVRDPVQLDPVQLGRELADELLQKGAARLLR